jgi:glycosyltransferase involved in cell wall biosynthesis
MSSKVVVTIESAAKILEKHFSINVNKIVVIHHGASLPDFFTMYVRQKYAKHQLGLERRTVLATLGLISSAKGIEFAIQSLSFLVGERPNLLYLVIGETHPEVQKNEGEVYRNKLISLTHDLGLTKNVRFVNRYLNDDELSLHLQAIDIYIAPYLSKDQVSSGTLTLALGHGKAVVSTPTIFAKEILQHDRGLLCKFAGCSANSPMRALSLIALRKYLAAQTLNTNWKQTHHYMEKTLDGQGSLINIMTSSNLQ